MHSFTQNLFRQNVYMNVWHEINTSWTWKVPNNRVIKQISQGHRERRGRGTLPPLPLFPGAKIFFPPKIGNHKIFTNEELMRLEFIYWERHKWQKVDSFFWICHFSNEFSYYSYQQRVCKIVFLTRTFVKTNL